MAYKLTRQALILDLYAAFQCAKRHKTSRPYVHTFERRLKRNIESLADDLLSRRYMPEPSSCFIVEHPKKREVFAAQFRDRVVHHLYYNYTHGLFERTFIEDTYSCIPGRGTHYGIERLTKHIRQESDNWHKECYVMKLDIRGYFMHINRKKLLELANGTLKKMAKRPCGEAQGTTAFPCGETSRHTTWEDILDIDFMLWLTEQIVMLDPKTHCRIVGDMSDWEGLDKNKSLFWTNDGCGLPIGNLTSQLFSNVYLNAFDQFMKRVLKCKHYGRYVDDAYVVSQDKEWLLSIVPKMDAFLREQLGLELHQGKLILSDAKNGVEFLGGFVKPFRTYISNSTLGRTLRGIREMDLNNVNKVWRSVNSFLGMMVHYDSYNIRCRVFLRPEILRAGHFDKDMTKFYKVEELLDAA